MSLGTEDLNKILLFFLDIKIEYLFNLHCIKLFQIVKERWFFVYNNNILEVKKIYFTFMTFS